MAPTILRYKSYRIYFYSKEESRMHVHVKCPDGIAKFWLEPVIALADFTGLSARQLKELQKVVEEHAEKFKKAWKKHFGNG